MLLHPPERPAPQIPGIPGIRRSGDTHGCDIALKRESVTRLLHVMRGVRFGWCWRWLKSLAMLCTAPRSLTSASGLAGAARRPASVPCAVRSRTSLAAIAASRRGTPPTRRGPSPLSSSSPSRSGSWPSARSAPTGHALRLGADRRLQVFGIWPAVDVVWGTRGRYLVDRRLPMPGRARQ
jgi:hypothetical protein